MNTVICNPSDYSTSNTPATAVRPQSIQSLPKVLTTVFGKYLASADIHTYMQTSKASYKAKSTLLQHNNQAINQLLRSVNGNLQKLMEGPNPQFTYDQLKNICRTIDILDLSFIALRDEDFEKIYEFFPHLTTLILTRSNISDTNLHQISRFTKLEHLNISYCHKITDQGLQHLITLTNLKYLNASRCWQISDEGLQALRPLIKLEQLELRGCINISDNGLVYLAALINLFYLNLYGCGRITNEGCQDFNNLRHLSSLDLSWCKGINSQIAQYLNPPMSLKLLYLAGCDIEEKVQLQNTLSNVKVIFSRYD